MTKLRSRYLAIIATASLAVSGAGLLAASPAGAAEPSAVSSVWAAIPGSGQVSLGWYAPSDGGSAITSYTVTSSPGSHTCTYTPGDPLDFSAPGHSGDPGCTVTGLTNGTAYAFSITATNADGTSAAYVTNATPVGAPGAPSNVQVLGQWGDGSAKIQWDFSTEDGGGAIEGYLVTTSPGGATCTTSGNWNQCTVRGLTEGTTYSFSAQAVNAYGTSAASTASASVVKNGLADAPTNVTVVTGKDTATVSWTKVVGAAALGYSELRGYHVVASPGGQDCYTKGSAKSSCKVVGLICGVVYHFRVSAWTFAGMGEASAPSAGVRLGNVPGAPKKVTVSSSGSGKALVSWLAPVSNGGVTISGYSASGGGATCSATGLQRSCELTGLTPGAKITVTVTATNLIGTSPPGSARTFTVV